MLVQTRSKMVAYQQMLSVVSILIALTTIAGAEDTDISVVTYGSTIKLEHKATDHRLHSHDVSYGTGSGQQSVTGNQDHGDANSYWIVKGAHSARPVLAGVVVRCGETFRLQHLQTRKNLHSHEHRAPLSRDNEVSAYGSPSGRWTDGDVGDDWTVECLAGKGEWRRGADIRLRHGESGAYLSASDSLRFGDPIRNQMQVSGSTRKNANTIWRTNEGFYLAPPRERM